MKWLHGYYLKTKGARFPSKWNLLRSVGKDMLSAQAQLKLEWIIFYHTISQGNAMQTAAHFGISRKTFHKWLKRFDEKNLLTLEEKSRAPKRTRQREINLIQRGRIRILRKRHLRWGKMKLQRRYLREYGEHISSWKIQKVIEQEHL